MKKRKTSKVIFWVIFLWIFMPVLLIAQIEECWVYTYNGSVSGDDRANDIIYAPDGYLYSAGYSTESGSDVEFRVISIDTNGSELWINADGALGAATAIDYESYYTDDRIWAVGDTFNNDYSRYFWRVSVLEPLTGASIASVRQGIYGDARAMSVVCGLNGHSYLAGYDGTHFNVNRVESGPNPGDIRWTNGYYLTQQESKGYSVDYGTDGYVYSAGYNTLIDSLLPDFAIVKNSYDFSEHDEYTYSAGGYSGEARSLVYGGDNNIYAAGYLDGSGTGSDFAVISVDNTFSENWDYTYDGGASGEDIANAIVYGSDNNLYIAGYCSVSGNGKDFTVISVDNLGNERWVYTYDGTANGEDVALDVVYRSDGYVYAAGYSNESGTGCDFTVIKLDASSGSEEWVYNYDGGANLEDKAHSIVCGELGYTYIAGYSSVTGNSYDYTVIKLGIPTSVASPCFYAVGGNNCVNLHWTVNMEDDNFVYYLVRKAVNQNETYSEIARIVGSGYSPSPRTYAFKDTNVERGMQYYYKLGIVKRDGNRDWYGPVSAVVTGLKPFLSVSPNPFTNKVEISLGMYDAGFRMYETSLSIYDVSGRLVKNLESGIGHWASGTTFAWRGEDKNGNKVPPGLYFCRLTAVKYRAVRKIVKLY